MHRCVSWTFVVTAARGGRTAAVAVTGKAPIVAG